MKRKRIALGVFALAIASVGGAIAGSAAASAPKINPANFTTKIDNPFMPWVPGTVFHYRSTEPGTKDIVSVTHRKTKILGVRCRVVRDLVKVNGKPRERSLDWYAQNKRGDVMYFGEASSAFKHGRFVHLPSDSWRAGVHGARPGIIIEAHPRKGDRYHQEDAPNSKDRAKVLGYVRKKTVPYGTFHHVLVTKEFTPLESSIDHDFYARGIGEIQETNVKGGEGKTKLVSITHH